MLVDSLKEILEEKISDPLESYRRIAAAIMLIAAKLDADTGAADTDYGDQAKDPNNYK